MPETILTPAQNLGQYDLSDPKKSKKTLKTLFGAQTEPSDKDKDTAKHWWETFEKFLKLKNATLLGWFLEHTAVHLHRYEEALEEQKDEDGDTEELQNKVSDTLASATPDERREINTKLAEHAVFTTSPDTPEDIVKRHYHSLCKIKLEKIQDKTLKKPFKALRTEIGIMLNNWKDIDASEQVTKSLKFARLCYTTRQCMQKRIRPDAAIDSYKKNELKINRLNDWHAHPLKSARNIMGALLEASAPVIFVAVCVFATLFFIKSTLLPFAGPILGGLFIAAGIIQLFQALKKIKKPTQRAGFSSIHKKAAAFFEVYKETQSTQSKLAQATPIESVV